MKLNFCRLFFSYIKKGNKAVNHVKLTKLCYPAKIIRKIQDFKRPDSIRILLKAELLRNRFQPLCYLQANEHTHLSEHKSQKSTSPTK